MAGTYGVPNSWDVGCDDCGEIDTVLTEELAKEWCDSHECNA
jgi:hypothetical protein